MKTILFVDLKVVLNYIIINFVETIIVSLYKILICINSKY